MLYNELIDKLDSYIDTHPNIITLWKHYIRIKRESYKKSLEDCTKAMNLLLEKEDLNQETIMLLYIFCKTFQ